MESEKPAPSPLPGDPVVSQKATINVVHAATDAPAVDVYLNGQLAVKALDYRKGTGNVELAVGEYKVELRPAGAAATTAAVYTQSISLAAASKTLVVAEGRLGDVAGSATAFRLQAVPFGTKDPGNVQVRFAARLAGRADGRYRRRELDADQRREVWRGLGLSPRSTPTSRPRPRSACGPAMPPSIWPSWRPRCGHPRGTVLTAIAFGEINPLVADNRFFAVSAVQEDSGQLIDLGVQINDKAPKASFYVVHTSPDAPAVDVVTKTGDPLIRGLAYRAVSSRLEVPGGVYPIEVRPAGQPTAVLSANVKLLPVLSWSVFAHGQVGGGVTPDRKLALSALPLAAKDAGGATRLRVVHAAPDAPAVDVLAGGKAVLTNLAFPRATGYLDFATGLPVTTLKVRASGQPKDLFDIVIESGVADATRGQNVTVFATGLVGSTPPSFQAVAIVETAAQPTAVALPTKPSL